MQEQLNEVKVAIPNVAALVEHIKFDQVVAGRQMTPFAVFNDGNTVMSAMGCSAAVKMVKVGWDGAMFSVSEGVEITFIGEEKIGDVLPIGRPGFVPM